MFKKKPNLEIQSGNAKDRAHPPRWREDFPVEWERDYYVTRREFAKFLTLGSALLAGASVVVAFFGLLRPRRKTSDQMRIATASALSADGSMLFRYPTDDDPCILVRTRAGQLEAYSQVCTHLSCAVVHKPEEDSLFCPCHHGYFSTTEGQPLAGPPTRRLPRITIEQHGDDIFATGVEP